MTERGVLSMKKEYVDVFFHTFKSQYMKSHEAELLGYSNQKFQSYVFQPTRLKQQKNLSGPSSRVSWSLVLQSEARDGSRVAVKKIRMA